MKLLVLAAVVALLGAGGPPAVDAVVHDGALRGSIVNGTASFLGIPYAAPPVGDLRWQPPAPPTPGSGVGDATSYGNTCPQSRVSKIGSPIATPEDSLFLNVFTTAGSVRSPAHTPVMFLPPGGGFSGSSGKMSPA